MRTPKMFIVLIAVSAISLACNVERPLGSIQGPDITLLGLEGSSGSVDWKIADEGSLTLGLEAVNASITEANAAEVISEILYLAVYPIRYAVKDSRANGLSGSLQLGGDGIRITGLFGEEEIECRQYDGYEEEHVKNKFDFRAIYHDYTLSRDITLGQGEYFLGGRLDFKGEAAFGRIKQDSGYLPVMDSGVIYASVNGVVDISGSHRGMISFNDVKTSWNGLIVRHEGWLTINSGGDLFRYYLDHEIRP